MFTESDLYREFGLEEPTAEGAQEQETTEPAAGAEQQKPEEGQTEQTDAEGAQEQDITEPAGDGDKEKQQMSAEERHANAARRRAQEREQLLAEAKAEAKKEFDAQIKALFKGKTNPYSDKPIESLEDALAMQQQERDAQIAKDLKAGKLTQEAIDKAVENNPLLKQAQKLLDDAEQAKAQADAQKQTAAEEAFRKKVEDEFREIEKLNPKIKSLNDIMQSNDPEKDEFISLVSNNGLSYLQAFKLAYGDKIAEQKAAAASAGAKLAAQGKAHLQATGTQGSGAIEVPDDVMAEYRLFNPDASEDEIRAAYAKFKKSNK